MTDLVNVLHDPGGKVKTALGNGVIGKAEFYGDNDCYRPWLSRDFGIMDPDARPGFVLWIGMNPSTADAAANDPTIGRESYFTQREHFMRMVKCNVMDYRATKPAGLRAASVVPCSEVNLKTIHAFAREAAMIVCAWGAIHPKLKHYADSVESVLRAAGHHLHCLGLTDGGAPRHPLYVRGDTPFMTFEERAS